MVKRKFDHRKLREAREEADLSVYKSSRELAKYGLDVSHQTIINWENGESAPNCHQLAELALFYGKGITYFFCPINTQKRCGVGQGPN